MMRRMMMVGCGVWSTEMEGVTDACFFFRLLPINVYAALVAKEKQLLKSLGGVKCAGRGGGVAVERGAACGEGAGCGVQRTSLACTTNVSGVLGHLRKRRCLLYLLFCIFGFWITYCIFSSFFLFIFYYRIHILFLFFILYVFESYCNSVILSHLYWLFRYFLSILFIAAVEPISRAINRISLY